MRCFSDFGERSSRTTDAQVAGWGPPEGQLLTMSVTFVHMPGAPWMSARWA